MESRTINKILKKTIVCSLLILTMVFFVLWKLDVHGPYHQEKTLWRLEKRFNDLARDPENTPPVVFGALAKDYTQFIEKDFDPASVIAAQLQLARIYILERDYQAARQSLEKMIASYKDNPDVAVGAIAEIGRTYTIEKKDEEVIACYRRIKNEYPLTALGLIAPLTIYEIYNSKGKKDQAKAALNEAIGYYQKFIGEHRGETAGFITQNYLAKAYLASREWESALQLYEGLLAGYADSNYFTPEVSDSLLRAINTLSITKLNDYGRPVKVYENFIAMHPRHPINPLLESIIGGIKEVSGIAK